MIIVVVFVVIIIIISSSTGFVYRNRIHNITLMSEYISTTKKKSEDDIII